MIVFYALLGALAGASIALGIKSDDKKQYITIGVFLLVVSLLPLVEVANAPKALDVYKEKTELKIDGYYKDNVFIATDSTVVWKED